MPHKSSWNTPDFKLPEWVEEIALHNMCLYETVVEALFARHTALRNNAQQYKACAAVMRAADETLRQIAEGRIKGTVACKKAAIAVRKYTTAFECAHPTAQKSPHRRIRRAK